jgi:hypothetical protein
MLDWRCVGWQPIETAPQDGTVIWLGAPGQLRLGLWQQERWADLGKVEASIVHPQRQDVLFTPTHWMPIPTAPEGS